MIRVAQNKCIFCNSRAYSNQICGMQHITGKMMHVSQKALDMIEYEGDHELYAHLKKLAEDCE